MDNITLYSSQVYLAEDNSNPDSYIAKFIISDFGRNKNGVALNRDGIENWLSTLKNKPLVGKIKMRIDGTYDFSGHNMKVVEKVDEDGNKYKTAEFDTDAFGSFFDISIETINNIEYIVASCEIWKRFSRACEIIIKRIQEGTLHTSWEIAVEKSHQGIVDGLMTKIIDVGRFFGHCLLAKDVSPAYDSSGLLEIASTNYDVDLEFAEALSQDIMSQGLDIKNEAKEENILQNNENINVAEEETVVETPVAETEENPTETSETTETKETVESSEDKTEPTETPETEVSALTEWDLRDKIREACRAKLAKWCWISFHFPVEKEVWLEVDGRESELDFIRMTYEVENDVVTVSEPEDVKLCVTVKEINTTVSEYEKTISEKDELIVKASSEITELKAQNTELSQYKEKFTQMEQEKAEAELAQQKEELIASVVKSGQISREEIESSEELKGYVNCLDKKSLMSIVGERLTASMNDKPENKIETSEVKEDIHVSSNLNNEDDEVVDYSSVMRNFLRK